MHAETPGAAPGRGCARFVGGCSAAEGAGAEDEVKLRLGYFPNVTHAPAIVGIEDGLLAEALGPDVTLQRRRRSTPAPTSSRRSSAARSTPATSVRTRRSTRFTQSNGEALRIVAGTTSGGAALVVSEEITSPEDLAGTTLATPQLGNTQDVALRAWLADQGYETDLEGGGDVSVMPQANAPGARGVHRRRDRRRRGSPSRGPTRMVEEGGGHVLVDEADLWPDGEFVTTHLIVAHGVPRGAPGRRQGPARRPRQRRQRSSNDDPAASPGDGGHARSRSSPAASLPEGSSRRRGRTSSSRSTRSPSLAATSATSMPTSSDSSIPTTSRASTTWRSSTRCWRRLAAEEIPAP